MRTLRNIANRFFQALLVLLVLSFVGFVVLRVSGDPVEIMLLTTASQEEIEEVRHALGYDLPWYRQYLHLLEGMTRLDFGPSLRYRQSALDLVLARLPFSLSLSAQALLIGLCFGIVLGTLSALHRGTAIDHLSMGLAVTGQAIPAFWLAFVMILVFAVKLNLLPSSGVGTWRHMIMPTITLAFIPLARATRLTRSGMIDVLSEDYVRTAVAKGASRRRTIFKHALKNAIRPVVTDMGMLLGRLVSGTIITETVFALPGLGRLLVTSIQQRDYPLVQASIFIIGAMFIVLNLLVDLLYPILDPRVNYD